MCELRMARTSDDLLVTEQHPPTSELSQYLLVLNSAVADPCTQMLRCFQGRTSTANSYSID